jgi:hypothetical protein
MKERLGGRVKEEKRNNMYFWVGISLKEESGQLERMRKIARQQRLKDEG